ncbi:MAG: hypothetical protein EOS42_00350 [Mesorhizobium sp.]|nr:MAG: hypothetical protein EOS42_00350 [Mesorhizobium sp.]
MWRLVERPKRTKHMRSKSSRDMPGPKPRKDKERDTREAEAKTPDKTNDWDRDLVHGEVKPPGLSRAWPQNSQRQPRQACPVESVVCPL